MTETLKERIQITQKEIARLEQKGAFLQEDIRFNRQMLKIKLRELSTFEALAGGKQNVGND